MNQIEYDFRGREVFLAWDSDGDWWLMDPEEKEPIEGLTYAEEYKIGNLVLELRMDWSEP